MTAEKTAATQGNAVASAAADVPVAAETPINEDLIVILRRPYTFEGDELREIDLNGLATLTAKDLQAIDDYIVQRRDARDYQTLFAHPYYMYYLAFMGSGLPMEAFAAMPFRTMRGISEAINQYIGDMDEAIDDETGLVQLPDPFTLHGKNVTELNLEWIFAATGLDMANARRAVKKQPGYKKWAAIGWDQMHQAFQFALAARALDCSVKELDGLSWRDAMVVRAAVINFLYD